MTNIKKNKLFFIFTITIALVIGFSSPALAQYPVTAPNPGGPVTVDGNYSEWDLDADFFAEMLRRTDPYNLEANAYLRVDYDTKIMSLLVLTIADTPNILITDTDNTFVRVDGTPPAGTIAYINQQGDYADGWEMSFPISQGSHLFDVQVVVENGGEQLAFSGKYQIDVFSWDYGDLPDSYGTYAISNGPKHFTGVLRLGSLTDGEADGQPDIAPILDDLTALNDEDGVIAVGNWRYADPQIQYTVSGCTGTCYFNAWVDWGNDGVFDPGTDELFTNLAVTSDGTFIYSFGLPGGIEFPSTFNFRFRLCDTLDGCSTPYNSTPAGTNLPTGEVEDYQWEFSPTAVTINSFTAAPTQNTTIFYVLAGSVAAILFAGVITFFAKRKNQDYYL